MGDWLTHGGCGGLVLALHHLRYFLTVADLGHITRASAALHLTQPALSAQIRHLESAVGVTLFVRHPRGVALTPAGEAFVVHARKALDAMDAAIEAANASAAGRDAVLRIGLITGAQADVISRALRNLRAAAPGLRIELYEYSFAEPDAGLRAEEVDAAFTVMPFELDGIEHDDLMHPGLVGVLPESHRLADRDTITVDEILEEPWAAAKTEDVQCRNYWLAMDHRTSPPLVHHHVTTLDKFMQLVAADEAVGMAPAWVQSRYAGHSVRCIPLTGVKPPSVSLAWPTSGTNPYREALRTAAHSAL